MAHQKPTIVFGVAGIIAMSDEVLSGMFSALEKHNVKEIDTAFVYVCCPQIYSVQLGTYMFNSHPAKLSSGR
jgi:hypothetical protein